MWERNSIPGLIGRAMLALIAYLLAAASALAASPSNPNANQTTRALLDYLTSLPAQASGKLLAGQMTGLTTAWTASPYTAAYGYSHYVTALEAQAGRAVALVGADYGPIDANVAFPIDYRPVNAPLIDHWQKGGLVTVMYSARNPWTGKLANDRSTLGALSELLTPGTAAQAHWLQQLDSVAEGLKELQAAGVTVLFRPLHEMNGAWFWWGNNPNRSTHAADLVALWRHMHDYFSRIHGLDNLLWVYNVSPRSGSAMADELALYPGDAYVDVTSFDHYNTTFHSGVQAAYTALKTLGKPVALAEYGPTNRVWAGTFDYLNLLNEIQTKTPDLAYFMVWNDYGNAQVGYSLLSLISNLNASALLADPLVVTRQSLPLRARVSDVDRLFDWAEGVWPELLPRGPRTGAIMGYQARIYSTGHAVGEMGGRIYYYNATDGIVDLGTLAEWLVQAGL